MCAEIYYIYPLCGCVARATRYTCYQALQSYQELHPEKMLGNYKVFKDEAFYEWCERYKIVGQVARIGDAECYEHRMEKVEKEEKEKASQKKRDEEKKKRDEEKKKRASQEKRDKLWEDIQE